jgi:aryl-alcohol dehydrogenase-like predicted oxidoreductase
MDYRALGSTNLHVSRLALGTVNFGLHTSEREAALLLDHAVERGINLVDTAQVYGDGRAESILGGWLAGTPGRRHQVIVATKVFCGTQESRLSAHHIIEACERSLRRLRTDRIDLFQVHHVDRRCPWDELLHAMARLASEGKILHAGSSNFAAWDIACATLIGQKLGVPGLVSEQSVYNLRRRTIELEVIPCCRSLGLALLAYSPLGGGLLAGAPDDPSEGRRADPWTQGIAQQHRPQLDAFEDLCREAGRGSAEIALAWVLRNPAIAAAIVGPRTVEQLAQSLAAADNAIDDDLAAKLEQIWPGPGGEAPQAYAW